MRLVVFVILFSKVMFKFMYEFGGDFVVVYF